MATDLDAGLIDQRITANEAKYRADLVSRLGSAATGDIARRKSAAFVTLCTELLLDIGHEAALACLVDGGDDAGVDAIHIGDVTDGEFDVCLFQGKYNRSLEGRAGYPGNAIGRIIETIRVLFDPKKRLHARPQLEEALTEVRGLIVDGNFPRVRVFLCNNGRRWESEGDARILDAGLPPSRVEFVHANHSSLVAILQKQQPVDASIQTVGKAIQEDFDHRRAFIGRIPVKAIAALFEANGDKLLDRNIRRYLGLHDNRVNSGIYKTLENPATRTNFYFFNNGITATCTKFTHNALQSSDHILHVENLQIVNGGQTCKTIQRRLKEDLTGDYASSSVLLRLYELSKEDNPLVNNITYATNSQNPVDLADLRANDSIQDRIAIGLKALGYEYKRKRDDTVAGSDTITAAVAAESIMSVWRRKPHAAKFRRSKLFGDLYGEIFTANLQPAHVLLSVLIFRSVENERKRGGQRPRFVPYASHFLAMVVGDLLLSQMSLDRETVTHSNVDALRDYFEKMRHKIYSAAVSRVGRALTAIGVTLKTPLPRVAAQFRRGDLLEPLQKELSKGIGRSTPSEKSRIQARAVSRKLSVPATASGQSGSPIADLEPNSKEMRVAHVLNSNNRQLSLAEIARMAFPREARANSWVRNSLRRLVRAGWAERVEDGFYRCGPNGRGGRKR